MPEFLVATLRIGFLALIWVFIALAAGVIRTDIFGERPQSEATPGRRRFGRKQRSAAQTAPGPGRPEIARQLVITEGRSKGTICPLEGVMGIGRAPSSTIVIDDDFSSSRHAILRPDADGSWVLEDLNSTNGTYVNAVQITQPTRVGPGDLIRIGRTQLRLEP
ncbi:MULTISPECIES: FHA domain-containing protein FhaB/FipA [unclassified Luteococcus]|uniref:FHA domain-containing protein FhaB/FipA n=1 Tax=unclassified Luteococcus TaxID=2639923 RepID=UPI00313A8F4D